ncbi:hypothetical protein D3C72_2004770 [compost metagenome]
MQEFDQQRRKRGVLPRVLLLERRLAGQGLAHCIDIQPRLFDKQPGVAQRLVQQFENHQRHGYFGTALAYAEAGGFLQRLTADGVQALNNRRQINSDH